MQKIYQYHLKGYSKVYKTLYVHFRTIYIRIRTIKNIPDTNLMRENILDFVYLQPNHAMAFIKC
jgi:hypothetical protein